MVQITELAAEKVKEVMASQNKDNLYLRLYITGFGCGGPSFGMMLDDSKTENDVVDEGYGVTIVSHRKFSEYLEGAVIDFVQTPFGEGFQIKTAFSGNGCDGCGGGCG